MALSPQFAAAAQALLARLQQRRIDIQRERDRRGIQNTADETSIEENHPIAQRLLNVGMADRGLAQSGIGLAAQGKLNRSKNEALAKTKADYLNDLFNYTSGDTAAQNEYNLDYSNLEKEDSNFLASQIAEGKLKALPGGPVSQTPAGIKPITKPKVVVKPKTGTSGFGIKPKPKVKAPVIPKVRNVVSRF